MQQQAVFRTDASLSLGSGHVRRCLVLRDTLARLGWATRIAGIPETLDAIPGLRRDDAFQTLAGSETEVAESLRRTWPKGVELLVVDSYRLDAAFESACRPWAKRILVIDDLADRRHDCDILLDANYGRRPADYRGLVPSTSRLLIGPRHCLLRNEFRENRARSLARRRKARSVERVFVSMGGVDPMNATSLALKALARAGFRRRAAVVLGSGAPHLPQVRRLIPKLPYAVQLHLDCDRVAAVMADCELALGAGGTMAWERFCLGLPSVIVPIAENQLAAAQALARDRQALVSAPLWRLQERDLAELVKVALGARGFRGRLQARNARRVDGDGARRVAATVGRLLGDPAAQRRSSVRAEDPKR